MGPFKSCIGAYRSQSACIAHLETQRFAKGSWGRSGEGRLNQQNSVGLLVLEICACLQWKLVCIDVYQSHVNKHAIDKKHLSVACMLRSFLPDRFEATGLL